MTKFFSDYFRRNFCSAHSVKIAGALREYACAENPHGSAQETSALRITAHFAAANGTAITSTLYSTPLLPTRPRKVKVNVVNVVNVQKSGFFSIPSPQENKVCIL